MSNVLYMGPIVIATLKPYRGHRDDVIREFKPLAESVERDEPDMRSARKFHLYCLIHGLTLYRGYFWLIPKNAPEYINVIEIYDGEKGSRRHGTGQLTRAFHQHFPIITSITNLTSHSSFQF